MRSCPPAPQSVPVGRQLCQFVEGWKHITNDPYVLKYRSQGYRLLLRSTPSTPDHMGNKTSPGAPEDSGNVRANIPNASEEFDNRGSSGYSRILFKHFPGTQSVRRMAFSNRFKPHFHMHTISSVLSTLERGLVNTLPRPSSFTLPPVSVAKDPRLGRPQVERRKIRAGPSSGYPVSWTLIAPESGESFAPSIQGLEKKACACRISSHPFLLYTQVSQFMGSLNWASGLIPLVVCT